MASPHPRTAPRGTSDDPVGVRVIIYSVVAERLHWIEQELARGRAMVQVGRSVTHIVAALVEDPAPRPQILVIDLDAVPAGELFHLHSIREQGWCGTIVALGTIPQSLRSSLAIDKVIAPPFASDSLCEEIAKHRVGTTAQTVRIPLDLS